MKLCKRTRLLAFGLAALVLGLPAGSAAQLLVNPGFESPAITTGTEYFGAGDGWTSFGGGVFTVNPTVVTPNTGSQALKLFGAVSGAYQQFPANPGELWNGGVWIRNDSNDPMAGGQVAAVNIEWIQADGTTQSAILPFISNGTFTTFACAGCAAPQNVWTLQTVTGLAPADAAFARLTLITGDFQAGGPGGAPFYDDAFFEKLADPVVEQIELYDTEAATGKIGWKVVCAMTSTSAETATASLFVHRQGSDTPVGSAVDLVIAPWETRHLEVSIPAGSIEDRTFLCKASLKAAESCTDCELSARVSILIRDTAGRAYGTGDARPQRKSGPSTD